MVLRLTGACADLRSWGTRQGAARVATSSADSERFEAGRSRLPFRLARRVRRERENHCHTSQCWSWHHPTARKHTACRPVSSSSCRSVNRYNAAGRVVRTDRLQSQRHQPHHTSHISRIRALIAQCARHPLRPHHRPCMLPDGHCATGAYDLVQNRPSRSCPPNAPHTRAASRPPVATQAITGKPS